jgi:hypothetical protein
MVEQSNNIHPIPYLGVLSCNPVPYGFWGNFEVISR